jgi:hypothetical protein
MHVTDLGTMHHHWHQRLPAALAMTAHPPALLRYYEQLQLEVHGARRLLPRRHIQDTASQQLSPTRRRQRLGH